MLGSQVLSSEELSSEELSSEVLRNDDTSPQLSPLLIHIELFCYVPMRGKKARAGQGRQGRRESMLGSDEKRCLAIEALGSEVLSSEAVG